MVDRLAAQGYVRRAADAHDRRAFRVFIDQAGEPLLGRMDEIRKQTEARALQGLAEHERNELFRLLSLIGVNLANHGA